MNAQTTDARLVRAVGTWGLAAAIVNITIGGGIFFLPSRAAAALGPAAPAAYVLCAVIMGLIVLCFAEAGSRVSLTGGLYAYVEVAFGRYAGFVTGVLLWAGITAATATVASYYASSVGALVPALGGRWAKAAVIAVTFAVFTAVNVRGVKRASGFNAVITVAKLLPVLLLVGVGLVSLDSPNLAVGTMPPLSDISKAAAVVIFAFLGVESALVPSGEVRDPARTIPRAIFIAIAGVAFVYVGVQVVAQSALGTALPATGTPVADAGAVVLGPWGKTLILLGATISMCGYIGGMTLAVPRLLFAFARDGFLPSSLGQTDAVHAVPRTAIVVQAVIHVALAVTGWGEIMVLVANGAVLIAYLLCCSATIQLRRRGVTSEGAVPFAVPGGPFVPILALVAIALLLASIPVRELLIALIPIVAATLIYLATRSARSKLAVST